MVYFIREIGRQLPFHNIPYQTEIDANNRRDELNRNEARKGEDGTVYETVSSLTLAVEEDREFKYQDANEW